MSIALQLLLLVSQARAGCDALYGAEQLGSDIGVLQSALVVDDPVQFQEAGARLDAGIPCLGERVPRAALVSAYRFLGIFALHADRPDRAARWFRTAHELDPSFQWDVNELPPGSPEREAWDAETAAGNAAPVPAGGMTLAAPQGATLLLDGAELLRAAATPDRYHLFQVVDASGAVQLTRVIRGNALPDEYLRQATPAELQEQEQAGRRRLSRRERSAIEQAGYQESDVTVVERQRPPAKIPLIAGGVVGVLAAGGVYGASFWAHGRFDGATTEADLYAAKNLTNTLVAVSGGLLLAGGGFAWWGAALEGGPELGFSVAW